VNEVGNKEILKQRAKSLAQPLATQKNPADSLEVVEFLLSSEHYALESSHIREVYPLKDFTPLPCSPNFVLGIMNVRGEIISIINLKKFFDLPDTGITDLNKVIIIQGQGSEVGVLADKIVGIRTIDRQSLQPGLPTLTGIRSEYLKAVSEERLVILEASKLLSDTKIGEKEAGRYK